MEWLNNANAIASLVLALFGIGGYLYGVMTYLKKKAASPPTTPPSSQEPPSHPQKAVSYKPLSWLEWTEIFAQGLVDTADFLLGTLFPHDYDPDVTDINKLGYCAAVCGGGIIMGEIIVGFAIGIFLSFMGISNPTGAAVGITTILLFMTISFIYIYHVGLRVEMKQLEQYRETQKQQSAKQ